MTIPDEAVQAAINAWFEETREYVKSVEPLPEQARRMRLALTAAYPLMSGIPSSHRLIPQCPTDTMLETMAFNLSSEFGFDFTLENKEFALAVYKQAWELGIKLPAAPFLQGVKVDSMDTAPKNGDEFLARCGKEWPWFSCFWDGSAFVHYDHTDGIVHYPATEWIPIPKRMLALSPSPRAQALEEVCKLVERRINMVPSDTKAFRAYQDACRHILVDLRALSSQPVADGCRYRLIQDGEAIEENDEFIQDDAVNWTSVTVNRWVIGMKYNRSLKAVRRPLPATPGASE